MPIAVTCPSCQKRFAVAEKHAGKRIKCPACGGVLAVPGAAVPGPTASPAPVAPPAPPAPAARPAPVPPDDDFPAGDFPPADAPPGDYDAEFPPGSDEAAPEESPPQESAWAGQAEDAAPARPRKWLVPAVIAGAVVVAGGGFAAWYFTRGDSAAVRHTVSSADPSETPKPSTAKTGGPATVASTAPGKKPPKKAPAPPAPDPAAPVAWAAAPDATTGSPLPATLATKLTPTDPTRPEAASFYFLQPAAQSGPFVLVSSGYAYTGQAAPNGTHDVFDVRTGTKVGTVHNDVRWAQPVLSPDGQYLTVRIDNPGNRNEKLFDSVAVATGEKLPRLTARTSNGSDGRVVGFAGGTVVIHDGRAFAAWDVRAAKKVRDLPSVDAPHPSAMTVSANGKLLAAARPGLITLTDVTSGTLVGKIALPPNLTVLDATQLTPDALTFSPDGRYVVAALSSHYRPEFVAVWNVADGALVTSFEPAWAFWSAKGNTLTAARLAVSADGRALALGNMLYSLPEGRFLGAMYAEKHYPNAQFMGILPNNAVAVVHADTSFVNKPNPTPERYDVLASAVPVSLDLGDYAPDFKPVDDQGVVTLPHVRQVEGVAFSPDGARVAVASSLAGAFVFDAAAGRLQRRVLFPGRGLANYIAFSPDGQSLDGPNNSDLGRYEIATGRRTGTTPGYPVAASRSGKVRLTRAGNAPNKWEVRDETGTVVATLAGSAPNFAKWAVSPDGAYVAGVQGVPQFWDAKTGKAVAVEGSFTGNANVGTFLTDSEYLLFSGTEVAVVDLVAMKISRREKADGFGQGYAAALAPDGSAAALVTGQSLTLYDPKTLKPLGGTTPLSGGTACAWSPDSKKLAVATYNATRVYPVSILLTKDKAP